MALMDGYYPVFLRLSGERAVVLGGGPVAARKVDGLLAAGASVTVISPALCPELEQMVNDGRVTHARRSYDPADIEGAAVVIAATDDPAVNVAVSLQASKLGIPINSVRPPSSGSFIVPSTIRRGGVMLAISTGGGCPALSKRLRRELEGFIGEEYGPFLEFLEEARDELKAKLTNEESRAEALTRLVDSGLIETFKTGGEEAGRINGRKMLDELINTLST
jgi:precorrin-2 dehydrogenase